jgi:DNA polymerase/3'-5' exonuclease PolX
LLKRLFLAMPVLDTPEVINLLREFGQRVALRGGNPYRAKAYARAAESLGTLTVPLAKVIRDGRLRELPGVGDAIAEIVTRLPAAARIRGWNPCARRSRPGFWRCSPSPACAPRR